ncbi:MAG: hypothetical protein H7246_02795 [Phycisphaerae bacterium]|nr:hypothetical protein [Saprospiraceae bacterium]
MKHSLLSLLAAALIVACQPQQNLFAQQLASPAQWANVKLIQFETSGCRGYCPIYKLTFLSDGTMEYVGSGGVEKVGEETVKLTGDEFSKLQKALNRADLWQYPATIPSTVVDAPRHTFTVFKDGKMHVVKGTAGLPEPVLKLEQLMQDIAESHKIMVKKGVDPTDPASMSGEVLVQFTPGVNVENFCAQFMEIRVRPMRRVSENNIWIIGFLPSELTETQFISILDGMEGVMKVQSNKRLTRN